MYEASEALHLGWFGSESRPPLRRRSRTSKPQFASLYLHQLKRFPPFCGSERTKQRRCEYALLHQGTCENNKGGAENKTQVLEDT